VEMSRKAHPDEKIIITSSFVKALDIVKEVLARNKVLHPKRILELNGTVSALERSLGLEHFNESGSYEILLLSVGCGGFGLNITGASHMIIFEPFWTPGLRVQVIGRADRLGQKFIVARKEEVAALEITSSLAVPGRKARDSQATSSAPMARTPTRRPSRRPTRPQETGTKSPTSIGPPRQGTSLTATEQQASAWAGADTSGTAIRSHAVA
jgi:superfamily II DNA or RNA helicase